MKFRILFAASLLFWHGAVLGQINKQNDRELSLNGKWQFQTDSASVGEGQHWFFEGSAAYRDEMMVPGNWNTENRYTSYTGDAWYKKKIFIPATLKGKLIRLYFEGVYNKAKVWVNGKFVMQNDLGYLQFEGDVSALLHYGKTNTIVVRADNRFKLGALWNWGGIRRPVKLLINNPVFIKQSHVTPQVNLSQGIARVGFKLQLHNTSAKDEFVWGQVYVYGKGRMLKSISFKNMLSANTVKEQLLETHIGPKEFWLWDLEDPNLYQYKIVLYKGKSTIDQVTGRFGLRVIELDNTNKELRLNGKVIRPIGFNLAPDDRTTGNTLPLWRVKEDIDLMKSLGAGFARLSHAPFHHELLDYLDEKGMLIFEEIPIWGDNNAMVKSNNPITDQWLRRMVTDHYNHPSIAGWSVANEIGKNKEAMAYTANAIKLVKSLDSTRFGVTVSYTAQLSPIDHLQLSDIGLMNSYGRVTGNKANQVNKMHPQSTLFLAEFGWNQLGEDLATDFPIQSMMDSLTMKPFLIGASLWTFNDYRSTFKDTKEASQNRPWGIVDVSRQKKKAFYSFREANKPVRSFKLTSTHLDKDAKVFKGIVNIRPRFKFDLPAYELEKYRVVLRVTDQRGDLIGGDFVSLPLIKPGDEAFNVSLKTRLSSQLPLKATISLVSRQDYVLYDTVVYFQKPLQTKFLYVANGTKQSTGQKVTQIRFVKDGSATHHKVRYSQNGRTLHTQETTNNYIDINLDSGQVINAELIAINGAGETVTKIPGLVKRVALLPPLIRFTEAADSGFFIGVETAMNDAKFMVQTTDVSGDYRHALNIEAKNKGVLRVTGVANNKTSYYRVKRQVVSGEESDWSEEVAVRPDGNSIPIAPTIRGMINKGSSIILCFDPVKKAEGYELLYKTKKDKTWHKKLITSSQIDQVHFELDNASDGIVLQLATINQFGKSAFTTYTNVKK